MAYQSTKINFPVHTKFPLITENTVQRNTSCLLQESNATHKHTVWRKTSILGTQPGGK